MLVTLLRSASILPSCTQSIIALGFLMNIAAISVRASFVLGIIPLVSVCRVDTWYSYTRSEVSIITLIYRASLYLTLFNVLFEWHGASLRNVGIIRSKLFMNIPYSWDTWHVKHLQSVYNIPTTWHTKLRCTISQHNYTVNSQEWTH